MGKRQAVNDVARAVLRKIGESNSVFGANLGSVAGRRAASTRSSTPVQRRRTQEERRAESEERLLAAAVELLARKGWVGMTLAEVGEAAGYSRGQATHQFGNKAALLRALVLRTYRLFTEKMQAAPSPEGLQAVLGYVRVYFSRTNAEWVSTRANLLLRAETLLENSETIEILDECNRPIVAWLVENLRIGIANGEVRPEVNPELGADFVVALTRGLAQQGLAHGRTTNLRKNKEQVVGMVEQAFAARSARDEFRNKR